MHPVKSTKFSLGQVVATPAALQALERIGKSVWEYIERHVRGDWGDVCDDDKRANEDAMLDGRRILSSYTLEGEGDESTRLWVITEAVDDSGTRIATTALLPEEY